MRDSLYDTNLYHKSVRELVREEERDFKNHFEETLRFLLKDRIKGESEYTLLNEEDNIVEEIATEFIDNELYFNGNYDKFKYPSKDYMLCYASKYLSLIFDRVVREVQSKKKEKESALKKELFECLYDCMQEAFEDNLDSVIEVDKHINSVQGRQDIKDQAIKLFGEIDDITFNELYNKSLKATKANFKYYFDKEKQENLRVTKKIAKNTASAVMWRMIGNWFKE